MKEKQAKKLNLSGQLTDIVEIIEKRKFVLRGNDLPGGCQLRLIFSSA